MTGTHQVVITLTCGVQFPMSDQPYLDKQAPRCRLPLTFGRKSADAKRWTWEGTKQPLLLLLFQTEARILVLDEKPRNALHHDHFLAEIWVSVLWLDRLSMLGLYLLLQVSRALAGSRARSLKECQRHVFRESTLVGIIELPGERR